MPAAGLWSKSWDEFSGAHAPQTDFIFALCDSAAREACPACPGRPATAHCGLPDPGFEGVRPEEPKRAFRKAFAIIERRADLFLGLPLAALEPPALVHELGRIGEA